MLVVWAWIYATWEILNTAVYIETELVPRIRLLVAEDTKFWEWEPYLAKQRSAGYNRYEWRFALYGVLILVLPAIGILISKIRLDFRSYWAWIPVLLYVVIMVAFRCLEVYRLQVQLREVGNRRK